MKKITTLFSLFCIFLLSLADSLQAQNIGINTDGSVAETGVMLDVKIPTPKATTSAAATFFQLKSSDADADALKLRMGFKTDATQTNRYGFIEFPDFASGTPTYLNLSLQPSGGNVGIGTTAPNAKLTVVQSTNGYANGTLIYGNAVGGQYLALAVPAAAQALIQSGNTVSWQALLLNPNGGNVGVGTTGPVTKLANTATNTLDLGGIGISSNSIAWLMNTQGYVASFVNTDATAGGRSGLLIKTAATDANSYPLQVNVGANNILSVAGTGNVGIRTTSPLAPLHIYSAAGADIWTTYGVSSAMNTDGLNIGYGGATWAGGGQSFLNAHSSVAANGKFRFMINWSDKMIIENSGNVGIGTIAPQGIFHIENGNARIITYDIDLPWLTPNRPAWAFGSSGPSFVIQNTFDYAAYTNRMAIDYLGNVTVGSLAGTGTALVQADASGTLSRVAGGLPGNIVLLYNNETSASGFTYANTTAFSYNVVGTFSQVKVEADIESDCSGGATVGLQGWNYSIVYNGVTKRTAQLWCHDTNTIEGIDRNNDWLSGHVSYMGAVANGQTVKIDVINTGTAGTWYVRNFRVYGVY